MKRRLPKGEETIPIAEIIGKVLSPKQLKAMGIPYKEIPKPSDMLLIKRVKKRHAQGREPTIYRFREKLTPQQQIRHMERRTVVGLEFIQAEYKLLEEEINILKENQS